MPKAASTTFSHVHGVGTPSNNAHVLRRNQACHQCRKRKLKCDAKRPCSTCVRSHAYAVAHAPAGSKIPPYPECTYDEVPDIPALEQRDPPRSRLEKLENRINELEALLSEKNASAGPSDSEVPSTGLSPSMSGSLSPSQMGVGSPSSSIGISHIESHLTDTVGNVMAGLEFPPGQYGSSLDSLADAAILIDNPSAPGSASHAHTLPNILPVEGQTNHIPFIPPTPDSVHDIISQGWPRNLPGPDLLRHLVDAYFSCQPDANRMFHRSTFLSTISLGPTHPKFPLTALLHAMCAVGSLYTAAVAPTPHPISSAFPMDNLFDGRHRMSERRPYSFAEIQAEHARREIEASIEMGEGLFQSLQAEVLLSTWYWASAKWSEAFMSASRSLRCVIPLGLNVGTPFNNISESYRPPSVIPSAKSVIEDEMRRNTFWIAYALERCMGCGHGWALMLDDQDVSQLLPVRSDQFENGLFVSPRDRQWSHDRDVLLNHPPAQTDPFVLHVKGCLLVSRIKIFNSRFRAKYYAGDPSTVTFSFNTASDVDSLEAKDIRNTPGFIELSQLIGRFQHSFPTHLRNPIQNSVVNPHLFSACTAPLLAYILLHEAHAHIGSETCESSLKILDGARGILNLVYDVYATSYDLSLLGQFAYISWFMAGRVLVRFLRVAMNSGLDEFSNSLQIEVDFIRMVLSLAGERIPLAHRYGKMLHDYICKNCGPQYINPLPISLPPRGFSTSPLNGAGPKTSDLALNLLLNPDNLSKWNVQ